MIKMDFDVKKSIASQKDFCTTHDAPLFAPSDGRCYKCHEQIYAKKEHSGWQGRKYSTGISTESAGKTLITGCPHCNYSFCE